MPNLYYIHAKAELRDLHHRTPYSILRAQGLGGVYLAGAWCGYGFHEDGLKSAIAAAEALGATVPWTPRSVSPKMGVADQLAMAAFDRFAKASITTGHLRFVLPNGEELAHGSADSSQPAVAPGTHIGSGTCLIGPAGQRTIWRCGYCQDFC